MFAEFFEVAGCYNAGGESDNGDTEDSGEHADHTSEVRSGVYIAIAYGREGGGRPIERVKEIFKEIGLLDIEHDQGSYDNIGKGDKEDCKENMTLFVEDLKEDLNIVEVANKLKDTQNLEQSCHTEEFERATEGYKRGQDRKQVYDGKGRNRV